MASVTPDRVKILHFVECWLPQTETWLYNHVKALPDSVESHIVCQWTQNLDQFPQKNLVSLDRPPQRSNLFKRVTRRLGFWDYAERHLRLLEQEIRRIKPDVLHSHFGHFGWINSKLAAKFDLPHVVSFYGFDANYLPASDPRWISRYRKMSGRVDAVLCEGPHMARRIADRGVAFNKIKVFRLGIDLDRIPFRPRKNPIGKTVRFLIASSFREKKGIPYAIEALGRFSRVNPDVELTVIGDAGIGRREQEEKKAILQQVDRWGLREKTHFLGYQPYHILIQQLYRHDIFLSPSVTSSDGDTEGGAPVSIIEAAASGMPVISTRHCDIPFVLSAENQLFLVAERDSAGLARAIQQLLDRRDWEPIVSANRELIKSELDVRKQGQKLAGIYERVVDIVPAAEQTISCAATVNGGVEKRIAVNSCSSES
jgi:colanic acid/amylovoran biosynthesis glycosyltransferase